MALKTIQRDVSYHKWSDALVLVTIPVWLILKFAFETHQQVHMQRVFIWGSLIGKIQFCTYFCDDSSSTNNSNNYTETRTSRSVNRNKAHIFCADRISIINRKTRLCSLILSVCLNFCMLKSHCLLVCNRVKEIKKYEHIVTISVCPSWREPGGRREQKLKCWKLEGKQLVERTKLAS